MKIADPVDFSRRISVAAMLAFSVFAACAAAAADTAVEKVVEQEETARKAMFAGFKQARQEAKKLQSDKKFDAALKAFNELKTRLVSVRGNRSEELRATLDDDILSLRADWSRFLMREARAQAGLEKYEDAIDTASSAAQIDNRINSSVNEFKAYCETKIKDRDFVAGTNVKNFDPKFVDDQSKIKKLFYEATILYNNGRYTEVVKKLEEVYVLDPLNSRATAMLERTYRKIYTRAVQRQIAEARGIAAAGTWTWIEPLRAGGVAKSGRPAEIKAVASTVQARMDRIVLPEVELAENTDMLSVLRYLQRLSKENDPSNEGGVTLLMPTGTANAATEGAPATPGEDKNADAKLDNPRISEMKFVNIALSDVLRYLCMETGLTYRIDGNTVIIGRNVEDMQEDTFSVSPMLVNSILGNEAATAGAATEGAAAGNTLGAATEGAAPAASGVGAVDSAKLKAYFSKRGIAFEGNSQISYNSRTRKMTVVNTPDNLRRLDELLRQLSVISTPMVMTEIKIIQISETDMDELSFYWNFGSGAQPTGYQNDTWNIDVNTNNIISLASDVLDGFPDNTSLVSDISIFPGIMDSNVNLSVSVNAISQHGSVETMSTPRLISDSGVEAWIKMVTRTRFPDSWDAPEITTNGDSNTSISLPLPNLADYSEYGTELKIKPTVSPDNYTIQLELNPKITSVTTGPSDATKAADYSGFDNIYGVIIDTGRIVNGLKTPYDGYPQTYWVWLPEFTEYSLSVTLKVFDGETVVMGGVTSTRTYRMEDRTPVLGSIPVFGRLFNAKAEKNSKNNLLFFVTARLVKSDGTPVNRFEHRGVPEFN